jgi:malonyl-CoA O-methyltransferase
MSGFELDRRALLRSFSRAAPHYDAAARLQQRVRAELLDRLQYFALTPRRVLDLGAGTCQGARQLQRRFRRAQVLAIDFAEGMLQRMPRARWPWRAARIERICADACALPLAEGSIELVFCNLMLQWCDRPERVFREIARVLRPGGLFLFASFGIETLHELRRAWAAADPGDTHVSQFVDMPQLAEALMHAGLAEPVMDLEQYRLYYPDALALMRELKQLGARNALRDRTRSLTGRARMQAMNGAYEAMRAPQGLPATYEVIYGAAFGAQRATGERGHGGGEKPLEYAVPLSTLRKGRR